MGLKDALNKFDFSAREVFSRMHTMILIPFTQIIETWSKGAVGTNDVPRRWLGSAGNFAFIGKAMAANFVASAAQSASVSIEALVSEALFVAGEYWYYKFLLNPQNVRMSLAKLQAVDETSDMTIVNTYRNTAPTMALTGISGCTLPRDIIQLSGAEGKLPTETMARYPKMSAAWLKFRQLEKFYNEMNGDIVILFDMDMYVGKFVNFNFVQDADNPWQISYDMQFRIYPDMILHTMSVYDYKPFFSAMTNRYGKSFSQNFEGKSKKTATIS